SAINPVFILPGALRERSSAIARELATSCTMGAGQFCTKPGVSVLLAGAESEAFRAELGSLLAAAASGKLLGAQVAEHIQSSLALWTQHGARIEQGGKRAGAPGFGFENTLASVSGKQFLEHTEALQTEAFGPVHLLVTAADATEMEAIAMRLEGSLTGCVYSHTQGEDDALYDRIAVRLRSRVGRLLNDK